MKFTDTELMVTAAAQQLQDGDSVLVGIGIPNLAANLAKRTHAPDLRMIYESGTIDSNPSELPLSIGDPVLATGAASIESLHGGFNYYLQAGRIDAGFLSGAQIDRRGNINSTVIGEYDDPDIRLPGSGGACEIASNVERTIIIAPHERQRFPPEVDFITSPGFIEDGRERHGLRGGPEVVITDKTVMGFEGGEMVVKSLHPGVEYEEVQKATGWELQFEDSVDETTTPTEDELQMIREDLDPNGVYL